MARVRRRLPSAPDLLRALRELSVWQERYAGLTAVRPLVEAVDRARQTWRAEHARPPALGGRPMTPHALDGGADHRYRRQPERCGHRGCAWAARYHGWCAQHWREAPAHVLASLTERP